MWIGHAPPLFLRVARNYKDSFFKNKSWKVIVLFCNELRWKEHIWNILEKLKSPLTVEQLTLLDNQNSRFRDQVKSYFQRHCAVHVLYTHGTQNTHNLGEIFVFFLNMEVGDYINIMKTTFDFLFDLHQALKQQLDTQKICQLN